MCIAREINKQARDTYLLNHNIAEEIFAEDITKIGSDANSQQKAFYRMSVVMANSYTDAISDNVKRSIIHKLNNGECIQKAPIGYLNTRDANGISDVVVDKSRAFLVKEMFEMYATGNFSIGDLSKFAKENNLINTFFKHKTPCVIASSVITHMLSHPFYCGEMYVKKYNRLYPHHYEVFITKELFDKCQVIRRLRAKENNREQVQMQTSKKDFVFRGLLRCAITGRMISSDIKKGKHVYLITWNPEDITKKIYVNEAKILKQIGVVLESIQIPSELLTSINKHLQDSRNAEKEYHSNKINEINRLEAKTQEKLNTLLDMRLENKISNEAFEAKSKSLKSELARFETERQIRRIADNNFKNVIATALTVTSKAYEIFESSKIADKRNLIAFMFSNLTLNGESLYFSLKKPFDMMVDFAKYLT